MNIILDCLTGKKEPGMTAAERERSERNRMKAINLKKSRSNILKVLLYNINKLISHKHPVSQSIICMYLSHSWKSGARRRLKSGPNKHAS